MPHLWVQPSQKSKYLYGICLHCGRKRQLLLLQTEGSTIILHRKQLEAKGPLYGGRVQQRVANLYMVLGHPFWGDFVKGVRHCSASQAHHIHGFNPHKSQNRKLSPKINVKNIKKNQV